MSLASALLLEVQLKINPKPSFQLDLSSPRCKFYAQSYLRHPIIASLLLTCHIGRTIVLHLYLLYFSNQLLLTSFTLQKACLLSRPLSRLHQIRLFSLGERDLAAFPPLPTLRRLNQRSIIDALRSRIIKGVRAELAIRPVGP